MNNGAHAVVAHRQHNRTDAQGTTQVGRNGCQGFTPIEPLRPDSMRCEIAVAEVEPGLSAKARYLIHKCPAFAGDAPPCHGIGDTGERVHDGVQVR